MSLKDYFKTEKVVHSSSLTDLGRDVESDKYVEAKRKLRQEFRPPINFESGSSFARYGSAEKYYEDSINYICNQFPYDGSRAERTYWEVSASYLDRWLYDNRYPRHVGHIKMGTSGKATGAQENGYGVPSGKEYIYVKGGPNAPESAQSSLAKVFKYGNKYDVDTNRESNLELKLSRGVTIEFWLHKEAFDTTSTEREVIFDLWNQRAYTAGDYGRLRLELDGTETECFRISAWSGSTGFSDESLGSDNPTPASVASSTWKHYAVTLKNSGSDVDLALYINGQRTTTSTIAGAAMNPVTGALDATIGALRTVPRGASYASDSGLGSGKLSASLDDFRYWKTARDPQEIGRNWFTNVYGGTNTDDANTYLGVYYKFNEGVFGEAAKDSRVLDYSGRISNGSWVGYTGSNNPRLTTSAMVLASAAEREYKDPVIYLQHPTVAALKKEMMASGSVWDMQNNSAIINSLPAWTTEFNKSPNKHLQEMTQIMGSYLDKLQLQIESLTDVKGLYGQAYQENDHSASVEPVFFSDALARGLGFPTPDLFTEASLMQDLAGRDEGYEFEEDLQKVKNLVYQNIYSAVHNIYKSKGTERSFRNLIRCFGVDEELIKINLYADNAEYTIREDDVRYSSVKRKFARFNHPDLWNTSVYQYKFDSVDNSRGYISGSFDGIEEHIPFTLECEAIFPRPPEQNSILWYNTTFITGSVMGVRSTVSGPHDPETDYGVPDADPCGIVVKVVRPEINSRDAKFTLSASMLDASEYPGGSISSDSVEYEDVYDNTKWNLAVRLRPKKWPFPDYVSGSVLALPTPTHGVGIPIGDPPHTPNEDYILDFYGVKTIQDYKEVSFHVSASVTHAAGAAFMTGSKRIFAGAMRENVTGSTVILKSDAKISNVSAWYNYLDNETIDAHAKDAKNMGVKNPYEKVYIFDGDHDGGLHSGSIPAIDTQLLYWNFATVTGSGPESSTGAQDGYYYVPDVTSGSSANRHRYTTTFGEIKEYQHTAKGAHHDSNDTRGVSVEYIASALQQQPEINNSSDMVKILERDDEIYTYEDRPSDFFFAFEKSMYQTISDEMLQMFATLVDFNNIIGDPINRYRMEYKDMSKLRQMFFEKVGNTPDLDKYIEYYKWFDSALGEMLMSLVPASVKSTGGLVNTIESHVLERNKYWTKYPSMEMKASDPETGAVGINEHLVNWKDAHHPISNSEQDNCEYWQTRAVPDQSGSVLTSLNGTDHVEATATIVISDAGGISHGDTFTLVDSVGTSTTYTINGGLPKESGGGGSGVGVVGFDGVGGGWVGNIKAAAAMVYAINNTGDANYTAVSDGVDTVTITQGTKGRLGNTTNTDSIGHTTVSNFTGGDLMTPGVLATRRAIHNSKVTARNRAFTTPARFNAVQKRILGGGTNFSENKNMSYVFNATGRGPVPHDYGLPGGMPLKYLLASQLYIKSGSQGYGTTACDDSQHPLKKVKVAHEIIDGMRSFALRNDNADDNIKANYVIPFNLIEDDVKDGYSAAVNHRLGVAEGVNIVNLHHDVYGPDGDTPMQGPFTSRHVGGRKFRHNDLSVHNTVAATATIFIHNVDGINNGDTFTLVDSTGRSTEYTIDNTVAASSGGGSGGSATVGFSGIGLFGTGGAEGKRLAVLAIANAINNTTDADYTADTNNVDTVTITQNRHGIAGNTVTSQSISWTTVSNFTGGEKLDPPREEGWLLLIDNPIVTGRPRLTSGSYALVGPDYPWPYGPYPFKHRPVNGARLRDETAKRPVNIRNIKHSKQALGNYDKLYQVVQTSGRGINNLYLRNMLGNLDVTTTGSLKESTQGSTFAITNISEDQMNFTLPTRTTSSAVIATKFASHGGPEQSSRGFLDFNAEEKSVYNAIPFRNLGVRGSGSTSVKVGTAITGALPGHSFRAPPASAVKNTTYEFRGTSSPDGLQTLRSRPMVQFGATYLADDSIGGITGSNLHPKASWHKVPRNARLVPVVQADGEGGNTQTTLTKKYDNDFVTHHIPRNDNQYKWIRDSLVKSNVEGQKGHDAHTNNLAKAGYGHYFHWRSHATGTLAAPEVELEGNQMHPVFVSASDYGLVYYDSNLSTPDPRTGGTIGDNNNMYRYGHTAKFANEYANYTDGMFIPVDYARINTVIYEPVTASHNHLGYPSMIPVILPYPEHGDDQYKAEETWKQRARDVWAYLNDFTIGRAVRATGIQYPRSVPMVLNSIIQNRQGPYGWPSWKQIRGYEHPIVRAHRKANSLSVLTGEEPVRPTEPGVHAMVSGDLQHASIKITVTDSALSLAESWSPMEQNFITMDSAVGTRRTYIFCDSSGTGMTKSTGDILVDGDDTGDSTLSVNPDLTLGPLVAVVVDMSSGGDNLHKLLVELGAAITSENGHGGEMYLGIMAAAAPAVPRTLQVYQSVGGDAGNTKLRFSGALRLASAFDIPVEFTGGESPSKFEQFRVSPVDFRRNPALAVFDDSRVGTRKYVKYSHYNDGFGDIRLNDIVGFQTGSKSLEGVKRYAGQEGVTLAGISYGKTVYPSPHSQGRFNVRKRERFNFSRWGPHADLDYRPITDREKYALGRRATGSFLGLSYPILGIDGTDLFNDVNKSIWAMDARTSLMTGDPYPHAGYRGSNFLDHQRQVKDGDGGNTAITGIPLVYTNFGPRNWTFGNHNAGGAPIPFFSSFRFGDGAGDFMNNYSMFHCLRVGGWYTYEQPVAGLRFAPSYARPHMLVSRDSVHNPSAPTVIKQRSYLYYGDNNKIRNGFEGITANQLTDLQGSTIGTSAGTDQWYNSPDVSTDDGLYFTRAAVYKLTRSLGHEVESLNVHSVPWEVTGSGRAPFYRDYEHYYEELKTKTQDMSTLPEYRISDRIDHYVTNLQGDFTQPDYEWLQINGSLSSSGENVFNAFGNLDSDSSTQNSTFYKDFALSDMCSDFANIAKQDIPLKPYRMTLKAEALMKFLPYESFYPVDRCRDMVEQFGKSYAKHIALWSDAKDPRDIARAPNPRMRPDLDGKVFNPENKYAGLRSFYAPLFAPGILFNTIKSGIAVDYPVLTNGMVPTASIDRDGGINWQINNEYFDDRIPFEALVEPEAYLKDKTLVDMEPHPDAHLNVTSSWDGAGDSLYKLMMHNFLAEIPNFFLDRSQLTSIQSDPFEGASIVPERLNIVKEDGSPIFKEYRALLRVYKSQTGYDMYRQQQPPSASNLIQNHKHKPYGLHASVYNTWAARNPTSTRYGDSGAGDALTDALGEYFVTADGTGGTGAAVSVPLRKEINLYEPNAGKIWWDNPGGHMGSAINQNASIDWRLHRVAHIKRLDNPDQYDASKAAGTLHYLNMTPGFSHPFCGAYLPVYETDRLRFRSSWNNPDDIIQGMATSSIAYNQLTSSMPPSYHQFKYIDANGSGVSQTLASKRSGLLNKPLMSITGSNYRSADYAYPRPQRPHATDTIMMYSRPMAFGPPCAGGYAISPGGFLTHRCNESPWSALSGAYARNPLTGDITAGTDTLTREYVEGSPSNIGSSLNGTTYGMKDSTNGYNAPFTPPYYDGQAWAFLTWSPQSGEARTLQQLVNEINFEYLRYEWNFVSGAYGDMGTYGPQGLAMNTNAMHIDASLNLKQIVNVPNVITDDDGSVVSYGDGDGKQVWSIQTKFETPILNFINRTVHAAKSGSANTTYLANYSPPNRFPKFGSYNSSSVQHHNLEYDGLGANISYTNTAGPNTYSINQGTAIGAKSELAIPIHDALGYGTASWIRDDRKIVPFGVGFPGVTTPVGMWHQYGVYTDDSDVGVFMQISNIPSDYLGKGTEMPIANPMFMTITGSPDPYCGAYDTYWDNARYLRIFNNVMSDMYDPSKPRSVGVTFASDSPEIRSLNKLPVHKKGWASPFGPSHSGQDEVPTTQTSDTDKLKYGQMYFVHAALTGTDAHKYNRMQVYYSGSYGEEDGGAAYDEAFATSPIYVALATSSLGSPGKGFFNTNGAGAKLQAFVDSTREVVSVYDLLEWSQNWANNKPKDGCNQIDLQWITGSQSDPFSENSKNDHGGWNYPSHVPYHPWDSRFEEFVSHMSGAETPKTGYRHSGSLSGSETSGKVYGQQVMRWKLNTHGPEAGLTADKVHLQMVHQETDIIVDTMWSPYVHYGAGYGASVRHTNGLVTSSIAQAARGYPGPGFGHDMYIGQKWGEQSARAKVFYPGRVESIYTTGKQEYQPVLQKTVQFPNGQWVNEEETKKQGQERKRAAQGSGYKGRQKQKNKKGIIPPPSPLFTISGSGQPNKPGVTLDGNEHNSSNNSAGFVPFPNQGGRTGVDEPLYPLASTGSGNGQSGIAFHLAMAPVGQQDITGSRIPCLPSGERMDQIGGWNIHNQLGGANIYETSHATAGTHATSYQKAEADRPSSFYRGVDIWQDHSFVTAHRGVYQDRHTWESEQGVYPSPQRLYELFEGGDMRSYHYQNRTLSLYTPSVTNSGSNFDPPKPVNFPEYMPDATGVPGFLVSGQSFIPRESPRLVPAPFNTLAYGDRWRWKPKNLSNENSLLQRWYSTQSHIRRVREADDQLQDQHAGRVFKPDGSNLDGNQYGSVTLYDTPEGRAVLSSRRTIFSGEFQPKGHNPQHTGSLLTDADGSGLNLGFPSAPVKLGVPAESQALKEAIVAVPYIMDETTGQKHFFTFQGPVDNEASDERNMINRWRANNPSVPQVMKDQFDRMEEFVLPPHLDFLRNDNVTPMVMYIFPFEYELNRTDVTDIWQGVMPATAMKVKSEISSISHTLDPHKHYPTYRVENPLGYPMMMEKYSRDDSDINSLHVFENMRFMVFKIKKRAQINYFKQTDQTLDDGKFNTSFFMGGSEIGSETGTYTEIKYSYNWPYDFYSIIEAGKLDITIDLFDGEYITGGSGDVVERPWSGKSPDDNPFT